MRRLTVILLLAGACASPDPGSGGDPDRGGGVAVEGTLAATPTPSPQAVEAYSADASFRHVRRLAGRIGPRPAGSTAYGRAVRYVRSELETLGYDTARQSFRLPQGGRSWNVVAQWGAAGPVRLLLGAHLDTVPGSPGGNDNASGVAVLLELARVLAAGDGPPSGLALVAFGAEELQPNGTHHLGSDAYVNRMGPEEREALEMMVSVDMIGKVRPFTVGNLEGTPRRAAVVLARTAQSVGLRANVVTLGDISDHGPFALAGMPAAFLWTGDEPNHHEPTDVVRNARPRALFRAGTVLLALIEDRLAA